MMTDQTLTRSEEDYVKAIFYQTQDGSAASTLSLAASLSVAPASVTNMLQKLSEAQPQLVEYKKHHGVTLTKTGRMAALRIIRRHRLIETFLYQVMGYDWDQVHAEADVLEHVISPYFEEQLAVILAEPLLDPHGEPIPSREGDMRVDDGALRLSELAVGQTAVISRVMSADQSLLAYIRELGIQPGALVQLVSRNPVDGTLLISLLPHDLRHAFGERMAAAIWVTPD